MNYNTFLSCYKPIKCYEKNHNLTISPFDYSITKHPKTDSRLKHEFGNNDKTHTHLNLEAVMNLEHIYL